MGCCDGVGLCFLFAYFESQHKAKTNNRAGYCGAALSWPLIWFKKCIAAFHSTFSTRRSQWTHQQEKRVQMDGRPGWVAIWSRNSAQPPFWPGVRSCMPQLAPFRGLWFKPLIPDSEAITVHGILPNLSTANQSAFGYLSTLKYTPVRYIKVADSFFFFFLPGSSIYVYLSFSWRPACYSILWFFRSQLQLHLPGSHYHPPLQNSFLIWLWFFIFSWLTI